MVVELDGLLTPLPAQEDEPAVDHSVEVDQALLDALDDGLEIREASGSSVVLLLRPLDLFHVVGVFAMVRVGFGLDFVAPDHFKDVHLALDLLEPGADLVDFIEVTGELWDKRVGFPGRVDTGTHAGSIARIDLK